jgi:hypothetical protein
MEAGPMLGKRSGRYRPRGKFLIAAFAATAAFAGGSQAIVPAPAMATMQLDQCGDNSYYYVDCEEPNGGGGGDNGPTGDPGPATDPGPGDPGTADPGSDDTGPAGDPGTDDPGATDDPCVPITNCLPGGDEGTDPAKPGPDPYDTGDPCTDYGDCQDQWNGPGTGQGGGGGTYDPCASYYRAWLKIATWNGDTPQEIAALDALLVCMQDTKGATTTARTDPAGGSSGQAASGQTETSASQTLGRSDGGHGNTRVGQVTTNPSVHPKKHHLKHGAGAKARG